MTALLASVRSLSEARIACAGGADILDLKEPDAGALGAVPVQIARDVVRWVDGRVPVSATVGDLSGNVRRIVHAVEAMAAAGVDIVKVGLFDDSERAELLPALQPLAARGRRLVAVLFADRSTSLGVEDIAAADFFGAMIDTADKRKGSLSGCLDALQLRRFVTTCQRAGLYCGLAGSIPLDDIAGFLAFGADYLGFRGALCEQGARGRSLSVERLRAVRAAIPTRRAPLAAV